MEIIFVCTKSITFNTFLMSQAKYLKSKGFLVKIACSDTENLKSSYIESLRIDFPTKYSQLINLFRYIKIFFQIKKLVKKNNSSIFYLHTPIASHIFRLFTLFFNLKIIYFVHGFRFTSKSNFFEGLFFKSIEKILSLNTRIFITINSEDFSYAKNNLLKKVKTYKLNGVGIDLKNKTINNKNNNKNKIHKILVIGAYKKTKGYIEILKIAESLKKQKIKIDCYGYGNFEKFKKIKLKKNLNNIFFKNFDTNLRKKIKKYDILLHLSKREGLPVSVMECLSEGVPVICTKIRGNVDLVKNKYNGFVVNSYKDVPHLISYLNKERKVFIDMKKNAIKSMTNNFSKKKINQLTYKIIKKNFTINK